MTQAKPRGKKSGGRVWAKIVSVLLSILLTVSLLATALVLDLRTLTNPDRLAQTLEVVMTPASVTVRLLAADGSTQQVDISLDASTEELLDLVYESLEETYGDELEMTREQLQRFYEKSTLRQRVSGLVAGYVSDLVNGTEETEITEEYILDVIGENKKLIESTFHVPVDDKMIRDVLQFVEVEELNDAIREDLMEVISATDLGGMTMEDFFQTLRGYAANSTLWILIGVNVLLIAVLLLVNWGRIASGLRCVAIPMVIDGVLLALPTTVVLVLMQGNALVSVLVRTLFSSMALVHYGMLVVGIVLLAVSIVLGVVMRKKR